MGNAVATIESSGAAAFELVQRKAKMLASSTVFPERFRGNPADCMIVLEMAERIGASPMLAAQNLYVVHGSPAWSAKFIISCVNSCGRFEPLRYETVGDDPKKDGYRCRAWTKAKGSDDILYGPWIDWDLVKSEKWDSKSGSKWKTIPELMFRYRAASWWASTTAPELTMGLRSVEEEHEIIDVTPEPSGAAALINKQLEAAKASTTEPDPETGEVAPEKLEAMIYAEVKAMLEGCESIGALDAAEGFISAVESEQDRADLEDAASEVRARLEKAEATAS